MAPLVQDNPAIDLLDLAHIVGRMRVCEAEACRDRPMVRELPFAIGTDENSVALELVFLVERLDMRVGAAAEGLRLVVLAGDLAKVDVTAFHAEVERTIHRPAIADHRTKGGIALVVEVGMADVVVGTTAVDADERAFAGGAGAERSERERGGRSHRKQNLIHEFPCVPDSAHRPLRRAAPLSGRAILRSFNFLRQALSSLAQSKVLAVRRPCHSGPPVTSGIGHPAPRRLASDACANRRGSRRPARMDGWAPHIPRENTVKSTLLASALLAALAGVGATTVRADDIPAPQDTAY